MEKVGIHSIINELTSLSEIADNIISEQIKGEELYTAWCEQIFNTAQGIWNGNQGLASDEKENSLSTTYNDVPNLLTFMKRNGNSLDTHKSEDLSTKKHQSIEICQRSHVEHKTNKNSTLVETSTIESSDVENKLCRSATPQNFNRSSNLLENMVPNSADNEVSRSFKRKSTEDVSQRDSKRLKITDAPVDTPVAQKVSEEFSAKKSVLARSSFKLVPLIHKLPQASYSTSGVASILANLKLADQAPKSEVKKLDKIKIKQVKTDENLRKLSTLRKNKIEENKRKREEKMERNLRTRIKIEKEKEQRFRSRERKMSEKAVPTKVERETRSRRKKEAEMTEKVSQIAPASEKKKLVKTPSRQKLASDSSDSCTSQMGRKFLQCKTNLKETQIQETPKKVIQSKTTRTPAKTMTCEGNPLQNRKLFMPKTNKENFPQDVSKMMKEVPSVKDANSTFVIDKTPKAVSEAPQSDCYAMTPPVHESRYNNYDISECKSDDESDQEENSKPIPSWALGPVLRNALITQHYSDFDSSSLFGDYIEVPDLEKIFGSRKNYYKQRTSSAIWHTSEIFG